MHVERDTITPLADKRRAANLGAGQSVTSTRIGFPTLPFPPGLTWRFTRGGTTHVFKNSSPSCVGLLSFFLLRLRRYYARVKIDEAVTLSVKLVGGLSAAMSEYCDIWDFSITEECHRC
jgi:hypothetical protein